MPYTNKITKTQKKFRESLLKLMETKKFEAITVNDITELADVNRSTFYRHYLDKYELLENIENTILEDVIEFHSNIIKNWNTTSIDKNFQIRKYITLDNNLFKVFEKHFSTLQILLSKNGSIMFQNKLNDTMYLLFKKTFSLAHLNISETEKKLLYNYQSSCFNSILYYWTQHPELSIDDLFTFYSDIMTNGVVNFVKDKMI